MCFRDQTVGLEPGILLGCSVLSGYRGGQVGGSAPNVPHVGFSSMSDKNFIITSCSITETKIRTGLSCNTSLCIKHLHLIPSPNMSIKALYIRIPIAQCVKFKIKYQHTVQTAQGECNQVCEIISLSKSFLFSNAYDYSVVKAYSLPATFRNPHYPKLHYKSDLTSDLNLCSLTRVRYVSPRSRWNDSVPLPNCWQSTKDQASLHHCCLRVPLNRTKI